MNLEEAKAAALAAFDPGKRAVRATAVEYGDEIGVAVERNDGWAWRFKKDADTEEVTRAVREWAGGAK